MLFFGHTGLTTGIAILLEKAINRPFSASSFEKTAQLDLSYAEQGCCATPVAGRLIKLDYRLVLVGSLLPDLIDKPLGLIILRSSLGNGRIVGHTLLFSLLLFGVGIILKKRSNSLCLLTLAFGSFMHLIFDQMWLTPRTLFWPLLGFAFPYEDPTGWLWNILSNGIRHPSVYVPEIIGLLIFLLVLLRIIKKRGLRNFLKRACRETGKIPLYPPY